MVSRLTTVAAAAACVLATLLSAAGCEDDRPYYPVGGYDDDETTPGGGCETASECPSYTCTCDGGATFDGSACMNNRCATAAEICGDGCTAQTSSSAGSGAGGSGGAGSTVVGSSSADVSAQSSGSGGNPTCVAIADHECDLCGGDGCYGSESWQYTVDLCESYYEEWSAYWSCIQASTTCEEAGACNEEL